MLTDRRTKQLLVSMTSLHTAYITSMLGRLLQDPELFLLVISQDPHDSRLESLLDVTLKELMRKSSVKYSFWSSVPFMGSAFSR